MKIWIPELHLESFKQEIAKLNRRSAKMDIGLAPMTVVTGAIEHRLVEHGIYCTFIEVQIDGNMPKIAGWQFLARIEHMSEGHNIVHTYPGADLIDKKYWVVAPNCDHCNTQRRRKDTFIVTDGHETLQVGSSCIKDFLGHDMPSNFGSLFVTEDFCEEFKEKWPRIEPEWDLLDVLSMTSAVIREFKWVGSSAAYNDPSLFATKDRVFIQMSEREIIPIDSDQEVAKKAIKWVEDFLVTDTNYLENLSAIVKIGYIRERSFGLACSILISYYRTIEKESKNSQWVGEIGVRQEFTIVVKSLNFIDNQYGGLDVYRMEDLSGNILVWFSTQGSIMEKDKNYTIVGTVKKHDEYKGTKQTNINRVKVKND